MGVWNTLWKKSKLKKHAGSIIAVNETGNFITALAFDVDRDRIAVGHACGALHVWSTFSDGFEAIQLLKPSGACVKLITISEEGTILAICGNDDVYIWHSISEPPEKQRFLAVVNKKVYKPKYITGWFHYHHNIYIYDALKHIMVVHAIPQGRAYAFSRKLGGKSKLVCVSDQLLPDYRCSLFVFFIIPRDSSPRLEVYGDVDLENIILTLPIPSEVSPPSSLWGWTALEHCIFFIKGNEEIHFIELGSDGNVHKSFKTHGGAICAFDVTDDELILLRSNQKISVIHDWRNANRTKQTFSVRGKIMREYPHIVKKRGNQIVWSCDTGVFHHEIEKKKTSTRPPEEIQLSSVAIPVQV